METFRSRLQKGDIKGTDWKELFILTRHWKDDFEFYQNDLQFLQNLIGRYSIWITSKENSKTVNHLLSDLRELTGESKEIIEKLNQHLENLSNLLQENHDINLEDVLNDQEKLENKIANFIKDFRTNRKQVYKVSEQILDSENLSDHNV